jgi:regulator of replication initiation timing
MDKKTWIIVVLEALLFLFILGTMTKCNSDKLERMENNIEAYKSEMETVKTENGSLIASKQSLILTEKELREELDISKKELKELKKTLGDNIAYIAKLETRVSVKDTIYMSADTVYVNNDNTTKTFMWADEWMSFSGKVSGITISDSEMSVHDISMNVPLEYGMTDGYKVFVKSSNPYVQFTDMNSVIVNGSSIKEKPKRFHHGISIGVGVNYGILAGKLDVGPYVGYGFTYSF